MKTKSNIWATAIFCMLTGCTLLAVRAEAAVMNDYCSVPPFVAQTVPPLVLLTTGRDHKLYYEAFNEAMDLDEDGRVDIGYMHNIDYYGYFDSYKCYTYNNTSALFSPVSTTADKFCASGQWSGNVLNWLTMSRMDVLRKVLYGGHRSTDTTTSTILERVFIPGDAHSWGKEIPGRLCGSGSTFKNTCNNNGDCDAGYSCIDKSLNLIGMAAATTSVCAATAVTWSSATNGKIMVAQFTAQAGGAANGPTHADLLNTYYTDGGGSTIAPLDLIDMGAAGNPAGTSTKVKYITNFNDASVNPENIQTSNANLLAVTAFTTANNDNMTGIWQFAVDGDDGVEVEILPANKLPTNPANWIVATYFGSHAACFSQSGSTSPNNKAFCSLTQSSRNNGFFNSTYSGKMWSKKLTACPAATAIDALSGTASDGYCVNGGISLVKNTKYYMIVRQTNGNGLGGVRVWYRKPLDGPGPTAPFWNIFGANSDLTLSSPTIAPGNECSIRYKLFVDKADTTTGEYRQHLFCSTTRSVGGPPVLRLLKNRLERKWNWASKERPVCADVLRNIGDTADITLTIDTSKADATKIWDYTVRDEVCKTVTPDNRPTDKQDPSASGRETNCRAYKSGSTTTYKPAGLLQRYGEGDGSKVCSRTYSKICTTDANCTNTPASGSNPAVYEGLCIDKSPMYFGLMTDSYLKNLSGGVLRKDIWSLSDEINVATGQFIVPPSASVADYNTTFPQGGIIPTFEAFRTVGFSYSSNSYDISSTTDPNYGGSCGWIVNNPLGEGSCRMWGNPIGEMMYEGLRYLAGKTGPTTPTFVDTTVVQDGTLPIFKQDWGIVRGSNTFRPYGNANNDYPVFPACSKPFMLVLSDENVSYDSDSIPGSKFNTSFLEDTGLPKLNIDVGAMTDIIGGSGIGGEGINGSNVFIGQAEATKSNFMCSSKGPSSSPSVTTTLSLMRGLCPEEPTKQGSYYAAGVAYYGKTRLTLNTQQLNPDGSVKVKGKPNVTTYSVVLSSPVPKMVIPVGGKNVTLVPVGKSTSGAGVEKSCANLCSLTMNTLGSLVIDCGSSTPANPTTAAGAGSFCPSNQIVDFYVDTVLYSNNNAPPYDASNTAPEITYAKFRINFEDVEQGADHDMDAISTYEICTGRTCSPEIAAGKVKVSVSSDYAAGGINQAMGFVISGTSEDDTYLVVRDSDSSTSCTSNPGACNLTLDWEHTFSVSTTGSTGSAKLLHSPLWYAAKWGGFVDSDAPSDPTALLTYVPTPNLDGEWKKNNGVDPDNFYLVVNPLKLETQLNKALTDILARLSSGTASSILNNSEGSGANLVQAVFYPLKDFGGDNNKVSWIGEMQNFWYFLDPFFSRSTVRVDSDSNFSLDLKQDYIAKYRFDTLQNLTVVDLIQDVNGDSTLFSAPTTYLSDDANVKSLWRAGRLLWDRDLATDPRKVYTVTAAATGSPLTLMGNDGSFNNNATVISLMQAADGAEAGKFIDYLKGVDQLSSGYRSRTVTIAGCGLSDVQGCTRTWKLGDIINSTPRLESSNRLNTYNLAPSSGYSDTSYSSFVKSNNYNHRGMAFVGANDGMLHAFKLGILDVSGQTKTHKAKLVNSDGTPATSASHLGREEWAFVPRNALPYLKYLTDPNYSHLFYVDSTATIFDASIHAPSDSTISPCDAANYWNCEKKTESSGGNLVMANTSWRTILIGGMGYGGASRDSTTPTSASAGGCDDKVLTGACVKTPSTGVGYSSYFAMDVTNPHLLPGTNSTDDVKFLWEFSGDPANNNYLGYTTSGPAIVRIGPRDRNGKWFAVFASGPTGPIDTNSRSFMGKSDQKLKIFVVDLATGVLLHTIDSGLTNAFAGSLSGAVSDNDRWDNSSSGFYSDDVVHIGYVQADTSVTPNTWTKGGVLRLTTKESTDPSQWVLSTVIDNIGPVTTAVTKLQDRFGVYDKTKSLAATGKFWLYFGTGRYFHKTDALGDQYRLFGIEEPCYSNNSGYPNFTPTLPKNKIDPVCTKSVAIGNLQQQDGNATTSALKTLPVDKRGWYVDLDTAALNDGFSSERVVTNPVASTAGAVFFTTFRPTSDICGYGGNSYIWSLKHDTGAEPPAAAMQGKALMQVSTGALAEISLADAFRSSTGNKRYDNRRLDKAIPGMPPSANGLALITNPKPIKKMMHYQEN